MIKTTVSDTQKIKDEIRRKLAEFQTDNSLTIGIHESAGSHEDSTETNAQIGAKLHFGSGFIPPRPWLDVGVASGNKEYVSIIENGIMGDESLDDILNTLGVVAVAKVQVYMTELSTPKNADSTIKIKGFDNPLIHTGELRQSVTYSIDNVKPTEGIG